MWWRRDLFPWYFPNYNKPSTFVGGNLSPSFPRFLSTEEWLAWSNWIIFLHNYLCFSFHCIYWSFFSPIWSIFRIDFVQKKTRLALSKKGWKVHPTSAIFSVRKIFHKEGVGDIEQICNIRWALFNSYYLFSLCPCLQIWPIVTVLWLSDIATDPAAKIVLKTTASIGPYWGTIGSLRFISTSGWTTSNSTELSDINQRTTLLLLALFLQNSENALKKKFI